MTFVFCSLDANAQRRRNTRVSPLSSEATTPILPSDSLALDSLALDSLTTDSLVVDSVPQRKESITAPVDFEASDSIVFTQNGFAHLYGEGKVTYEQINLAADVITMNIDSTTVFAYGREDSLGVVKGKPVFTEGETPYETKPHLRQLPPCGWVTDFGCCRLPWCDGRCVQDPGTYSPRHG